MQQTQWDMNPLWSDQALVLSTCLFNLWGFPQAKTWLSSTHFNCHCALLCSTSFSTTEDRSFCWNLKSAPDISTTTIWKVNTVDKWHFMKFFRGKKQLWSNMKISCWWVMLVVSSLWKSSFDHSVMLWNCKLCKLYYTHFNRLYFVWQNGGLQSDDAMLTVWWLWISIFSELEVGKHVQTDELLCEKEHLTMLAKLLVPFLGLKVFIYQLHSLHGCFIIAPFIACKWFGAAQLFNLLRKIMQV